ncbi:MAG: quinol oxidase [Desulfuromonadaceae bacterium]|nr:quinol oxidase [Desulfuromonadaceae bacterium]
MKSSRFALIIIVFVSLYSITIHAADAAEKVLTEGTQTHDHGTWQEKRFVATVDGSGVQRAEIVGGEYFYDPNYIIVKVNKPVELKVKKSGGYIPHDLVANSPEAGIDFKLDLKRDAQTITFTPTKTGKYPIYCDKGFLWLKSHREKGMEGVIEVVE